MLTFKSSLKALGAASLLGLSSFIASAPASAQSLADVVKLIQKDSNELSAENTQRLKEFQQDKAAQEAKMSDAKNALAAAEGRGRALGDECDANEAKLGDLEGRFVDDRIRRVRAHFDVHEVRPDDGIVRFDAKIEGVLE